MDTMPPDNQLPPHHAPSGLKFWLTIFAVLLVGVLGYLVWNENTSPDIADNSPAVVKDVAATSSTAAKNCDFTTVNPTLKAAVTYDLGGTEEFDTLVCGYLTTKQEDMAFEGDPPQMKNRAYLNIAEFADSKFKDALDKQIAEGNTVNAVTSGIYQLGCGCSESNKLISDTGDLADAASSLKLIASTALKPVIVKIGFQIHGGRGCSCCNLADKFEVL